MKVYDSNPGTIQQLRPKIRNEIIPTPTKILEDVMEMEKRGLGLLVPIEGANLLMMCNIKIMELALD